MRKIISRLFSRLAFTALFMLLQIAALAWGVIYFQERFYAFYVASVCVGVGVVLYIINENSNPAYKIAWIIPVLVLPVFGILFYLMFGKNRLTRNQTRRLSDITARYRRAMVMADTSIEELQEEDQNGAIQASYLFKAAGAPVFAGTETEFLPIGQVMYQRMLEELEKARRYIFLEYFIIEPGKMWDGIYEILKRKAAQGVDVRVLYDDFGSIFTLPRDFDRTLQKQGIQCRVFHRFVPVLSGRFNNRDHRKICVVDGVSAFTGGINLADEYINEKVRFGHWLDCGVMLRGEAAWGFAAMFLSMWDYVNNADNNYMVYRPEQMPKVKAKGFVVPFSDVPLDNEAVGETAYMNMINRAESYVYLSTPYLVPSNEMICSLKAAAASGIDVRIITPHIPDKRTIFAMTRSNYAALIEAGVRIYEYTPGFCHSKMALCDDKYGLVGSINMDYRSLYLHYECAAWMYGADAVAQMKESFVQTLESCKEITLDWCRSWPWYKRLAGAVLRAFAPLA